MQIRTEHRYASQPDEGVVQPIDPAGDYETAMARLAQVHARERADETINPVCRSAILTHGSKVEHVIILMHDITKCPQQFFELAPLFFQRGYNVLIPRMPRNGHGDHNAEELKYLTAAELCAGSNSMVDIAHGLGEHVTYAGLSAGGTLAAWVAQNRADVDKAVLIAPDFTFSRGLGVTLKRLGFSVYGAARTAKPAARSVLVITNASDPAVEISITRKLVKRWQRNGFQRLDTYEFAAKYQLINGLVDPERHRQQTALVYPILLDLVTSKMSA